MGGRVLIYFVNFLIFSSFLTCCSAQQDVIIDSVTDLESVLFEPTTCTYVDTHSEMDSCKVGVVDSCSSGFWGSCVAQSCRNLGDHGQIPKKLHALTYFGGSGAEIQVRWKRNAEAPFVRIDFIPFTQPGWFLYTRDLTTLIDFTTESIINLRFASFPAPDYDADIVDRIIFSFEEDSPDPSLPCDIATTTEPASTLGDSTLDTTIAHSTVGTTIPDIIIDSSTDLDAVLSEPTTCTYVETHSEMDSCKVGVEDSCSSGFWGSCVAQSCEISILVENLGDHGQVPKKVHVLTYFGGSGAEIQVRWKRNAAAPFVRLDFIPFTQPGWFSYTRDLSGLIDFTTDSIINLRFSSVPLPEFDADIVDRIIFSFEEDSPDPSLPCDIATTTEPASTLADSTPDTTIAHSTVEATIPDVIIDSVTDLDLVLFEPTTCTYVDTHSEMDSCKVDVEDSCSSGFWGSCVTQSCEISILVGNLGDHGLIPKKLHIFTYFGGSGAEIQVRWKRNAAAPFVRLDFIPFTQPGWFFYTRDLTGLIDFTTDSIINLRFSSVPLPEFDADIVDRIIFSFEEDSPDPSLPCEAATTTIEPSTRDTAVPPSTVVITIPDVIIDSETDLDAVLLEPTTCTYVDTHSEMDSCKEGVEDSCSSGFWGSCVAQSCEISILMANLGDHGLVPKKVHVLTYFGGSGAEIQVRWKRNAAAPFVRLDFIPFTQPGWFLYTRDLTGLIDFTTDSIINLRFSSVPLPEMDADIVDRIIFSFEEGSPDPSLPCDIATTTEPVSTIAVSTRDTTIGSPSTVETTVASSTVGNTLPGKDIDSKADMEAVLFEPTTCTYAETHADICKEGVEFTSRTGFWSSCHTKTCDISILVGKLDGDGKVPTKVDILAYYGGMSAQIQVRWKMNADAPYVVLEAIPFTQPGWFNYTRDLTDLIDFTPDSIISLRFASNSLPGSDADIVDQIIFSFEEDSTETTTVPSTIETTTDPTIETTTTDSTTTDDSTISSTSNEPSSTEPSRPPRPTREPEPEEDDDKLLEILLFVGGGILLVGILIGALVGLHYYNKNKTGSRRRLID